MTDTPTTRLPPGPVEPAEEQVARFSRDPFGYLETLEQLGTMFTLKLGSVGNEDVVDIETNGNWIFLTRPHQVKAMHSADEDTVTAAEANKIFFGTEEGSVGYIEGMAHRTRRSQLHPLLGPTRDFTAIIEQSVHRRIEHWPRHTPFRLFDELQKLTSSVIVEVVCGAFNAEDQAALAALLPGTENADSGPDELRGAEQAIRAFVEERLDDHLKRVERVGNDDLTAALLRTAEAGDTSLTLEVIRDEVFSLLFTGFSTTSNTLAWAFKRVLGHPEVEQALHDEFGDRFRTAGPLNRKHFADLPYLEATLKETLRLHPVSPLNGVRMTRRPFTLDGWVIPPRTFLVQCAYLLQRCPEVYDNPVSFRPGRFLDGPIDPYAWGPFGGGSRTCVGKSFSIEEMKVVLALVLSRVDLESVGGLPSAEQQGFFLAPADGALCRVKS